MFPFTRCVLSFCFSEESAVRLRGRFVSLIKKRGGRGSRSKTEQLTISDSIVPRIDPETPPRA